MAVEAATATLAVTKVIVTVVAITAVYRFGAAQSVTVKRAGRTNDTVYCNTRLFFPFTRSKRAGGGGLVETTASLAHKHTYTHTRACSRRARVPRRLLHVARVARAVGHSRTASTETSGDSFFFFFYTQSE